MAVLGPGAHAKPNVEEGLGLLDGGNDLLELDRIAAERLLAEHMLAGSECCADDLSMVRRRHTDVNDIHIGILRQRKRTVIHLHTSEVERL